MDTIKSDLIATQEIFGILETSADISTFIWDHLPLILFVSDERGNVLKANTEACRFLKKKPKALLGKKLYDLFNDNSASKYFKEYFRSENSSETQRAPFQSYIGTKSEYTFWQIKYLDEKLAGDYKRLFAIIGNNSRDLIQAYQGELIKTSTLTSMATLAAGVAHEVNNPLMVIKGCNEIVSRMAEDNPSLQKFTNDISKHVKRIADIVQHLRNFSDRTPTTGLSSIDINHCVRSVSNFNKHSLKSENITLSLSLNEDLYIKGNSKEIESILQILIDNTKDAFASIADKRKRYIKIQTYEENGKIILKFEDNGEGIASEDVDRIFDPFYTTKDVGKGTGLGLSRLYNIVKMHSGIVDVESEPGKFTWFQITFPKFTKES